MPSVGKKLWWQYDRARRCVRMMWRAFRFSYGPYISVYVTHNFDLAHRCPELDSEDRIHVVPRREKRDHYQLYWEVLDKDGSFGPIRRCPYCGQALQEDY